MLKLRAGARVVFSLVLCMSMLGAVAYGEEPEIPQVGDILNLTVNGEVRQYEVLDIVPTAPELTFVIVWIVPRGGNDHPDPEVVTWGTIKSLYN